MEKKINLHRYSMKNKTAFAIFSIISLVGLFFILQYNGISGDVSRLVAKRPVERMPLHKEIPSIQQPTVPPSPCKENECIWAGTMQFYVSQLGAELLGMSTSNIGKIEYFKKMEITLKVKPSFYDQSFACLPKNTKLDVDFYKGKKLPEKYIYEWIGFVCNEGKWWVGPIKAAKELEVPSAQMTAPSLPSPPCFEDTDCKTNERCVQKKCKQKCGKIPLSFCIPKAEACSAYSAVDPSATDCPSTMKCCKPV
ncbi:hypothetical protein HY498_03755 [Candidatus Woesearchaeota archaeon]|nr:hypothetical protein [Candidatus Woesearchaeota archaeon]